MLPGGGLSHPQLWTYRVNFETGRRDLRQSDLAGKFLTIATLSLESIFPL